LTPRIKVVTNINRATATLALTNRPPLGESSCTSNRRLVDTLAGVDIVGAAVAAETALVLGAAARVVRAEILDNVVLDQRVAEPAVEGQVGVAAGIELGGVGDGVVAAFGGCG